MTSRLPLSLSLRSHFASTCSWRVRLALHARGTPHSIVPVDILAAAHRENDAARTVPSLRLQILTHQTDSPSPDDAEAERPRFLVPKEAVEPLLSSGGSEIEIGESLAILELLDELEIARENAGLAAQEQDTHTTGGSNRLIPHGSSLLGASPIERAQNREVVQQVVSGGQPLQNVRVRDYLEAQFAELSSVGSSVASASPLGLSERVQSWSTHWTLRSLEKVEGMLAASDWTPDAPFSAVDCVLIPHAFAARKRYDIDLNRFPIVSEIERRLRDHPRVRAAHPLAQVDAPSLGD
jgi:maleylacetoacetate isomerase